MAISTHTQSCIHHGLLRLVFTGVFVSVIRGIGVEDEPCPVADQMLGEMYRASAHGLNELIATVSPTARVLLAVYCYRRAHLASIGLAIAATCEKDDLTSLGGNAGATLFERSREAPKSL